MAKIGLILEGGGMRGCYTAGVLDWFLDNGLEFQQIYGVSAGACGAMSYLSRQRERTVQINTQFCTDPRYVSYRMLLTKGSIFGMDFMFHEIPDKLLPFDYDTFFANTATLTAVTTNCETGLPEYHPVLNRKDIEYVKASSSLPMMARIVEVDGLKLLDGGASDSIPVEKALADGFCKNIIVLTRNKGYQKKRGKFNFLYHLRYGRRYPKLVKTLCGRWQNYNKSLALCEQLEQAEDAIVLRPSEPVQVDRAERDPQKLWALYHNGYKDAAALGSRILKFCKDSETVKITQVTQAGELK